MKKILQEPNFMKKDKFLAKTTSVLVYYSRLYSVKFTLFCF